ncbi:LacI family DNA-binding transcriptional regulator [Gilvimarinus sp. SDUM040013]|uniref:LacI family DNA-binding transcriptional regulator n=1 Tax=Gilvimarinus gilvus TaxID=3058038 RepID=A0ABU4RTR8_9GAMM|nr:LacI family DNA-binding transcriptional regulator [Gilvimarinus sp. SDUM040013]MDO3387047.1 LacI family DNA-binding transcriptional regulator [Gilvimarinus sp. SDUM040013]MDX6848059.1 LacI family DNA-binding transcriptional regulator [Gilvimarinus sp. SDUM040013]
MGRARKSSTKRATLADVAKVANVSAITVSRVINQPGKVSPELGQRVQEAIDMLGYIPNQSASSLASARSGVIGVSIPSLSNVVFNDVLRGIYDVAGASDYKVLLVDTHYSPLEEEKMVRTLLSQSPEAMIITGGDQTRACERMLAKAGMPVVQIMELLEQPLDMNVGFSHYQAGYDVALKMLATGCNQLGFVGARMDARVQQRMAGFVDALRAKNKLNQEYIVTTPEPSSIALGGELFRSLLSASSGAVDGIFCCNDDLALGALFESQRMNIKIPTEMSLCGFNDFETSAYVNPSLSSVHVPRYEMGVKAAEMIINVLNDKGVADKTLDIGFEVILRQSSRASVPPQ